MRPRALLLACAVALAGCAVGPAALTPGESLDATRQRLGPPSAEHRRPDGGRRLEYGGGRFGKHAWMLDFDAQGRLLQAQDVRNEATFNQVRAGQGRDEVLSTIGAPSYVWRVRYHDQTVWTYRYDGPFCLVFHVGLTPQGIVEDTSYGPDPLCEPPDERFR